MLETTKRISVSIKKNDSVQVITGRDKGKVGKVLTVDHKFGRVVVERVNMVKRHSRPTQKNPHGGILEKEAPLHRAKVLLFCGKCNRGVRHGYKMVEAKVGKKGVTKASALKKIRVCRRCGEALDTV